MRSAFTHFCLGAEHPMCADTFEDPGVLLADPFRPDALDAEVDERSGHEHARLDVGTDRHDGRAELGGAQLAQCDHIGGVRLHHVGEVARVHLNEAGVGVDAEHLGAETHERACKRTAEAAESDHHDGARRHVEVGTGGCVVSQGSVAPLDSGIGDDGRAAPARCRA